MNMEQKEEHYEKLFELLKKHENSFSKREQQLLYISAQNYCAQQMNSGSKEYLKKTF